MSTSTFQASGQQSSTGFGNPLAFGPFFPGKHSVEEDEDKPKEEDRMATPDVKSYLRLTDPDDKFPTLIRRGGDNPSVCAPGNSLLHARYFADTVNVAYSQLGCCRFGRCSHPGPRYSSCKPATYSPPESSSERLQLASRRKLR